MATLCPHEHGVCPWSHADMVPPPCREVVVRYCPAETVTDAGESAREEAGRLLIMDPDAKSTREMSRQLRGRGYDVTLARSFRDGRSVMEQGRVSLVLTETHLPDGRALSLVRSLPPPLQLIPLMVVTDESSVDTTIEALRMGVIDFMLKPSPDLADRVAAALLATQAREALRRVHTSIEQCAARMETAAAQLTRLEQTLCRHGLGPVERRRTTLDLDGLSEREGEVTELLALGLSNKLIASRLFLSEHTVKNHVRAIFRKTGVNSRLELVARLPPRRGE